VAELGLKLLHHLLQRPETTLTRVSLAAERDLKVVGELMARAAATSDLRQPPTTTTARRTTPVKTEAI